MAAHRGSDDGAFSWPPTDSDLAVIDVVSTAAPPPTHAWRPPVRATRPARFKRGDGLLLLAAGMLFGSAVPSLDTRPPTRIGLSVDETRDASAATAYPSPRASAPTSLRLVPVPHEPRPAWSQVTEARGRAASPVVASVPAARTVDPRTRQVVAVLQSYGRAWSRMDANAARIVMPTADVDELTRTFTALREQKLTLSGCRVSGTGSTATASCTATRRYRPRQGDHATRVERGRWQFRVVRTRQRWVIADVDRR